MVKILQKGNNRSNLWEVFLGDTRIGRISRCRKQKGGGQQFVMTLEAPVQRRFECSSIVECLLQASRAVEN